MTLCDDGHQEVCFEGRSCPLCDVIYQKDAEISELTERIADLEAEVQAA